MDFARTYDETAPSPALRPLVECYWWSEVRAPADCRHRNRVLPDGCIDVLFDLAGGPRACVVGAMTRALLVEWTGPRRIVAVRFRPGGARVFFRPPLHEWTDRSLELVHAWPEDRALEERMAEAAFPGGALKVLDEHLLGRLSAGPADDDLRGALLWLWQQPALSVREAAARLGLTRQHLARRCKAVTGLGPKQLQRVARLQRALDAARDAVPVWSRIALDAGYCDQAHLIGEFRALTGLTPVQLMA